MIILVFLLVVSGVGVLANELILSLTPDQVAQQRHRVEVNLAQLPEQGFYTVNYRGYKAFIGKHPKLRVFLMPYNEYAEDGLETYYLPDPSWQRPFIPCRQFRASAEGFGCTDPQLHQSWHREARWDASGNNLGDRMPDLQEAKFAREGDNLVLSPELGTHPIPAPRP